MRIFQANFKCFVTIITMTIAFSVNGQRTIYGCVKDSLTGVKLPFTQIRFISSNVGMYSDTSGCFSITPTNEQDTLLIRLTGYHEKKYATSDILNDSFEILLATKIHNLDMVFVTPGDSRITKILKRINEGKAKNDIKKQPFFECQQYEKKVIELDDIDQDFFEKKSLNKIDFISDYLDTTNGARSLPIYFSENICNYYYNKTPNREKRVIKGISESGTMKLNLEKTFTSNTQNLNFYDNNCLLYGKAFQSPIANNAELFYQYEIAEDDTVDGQFLYHIFFQPKYNGGLLFSGEFWIDQQTHSLVKINADIPAETNINYISSLTISQNFELIDSFYFMQQEKMVIKCQLPQIKKNKEPTFGVITQELIQKDVKFDKAQELNFYDRNSNILDNANQMSSDFWLENRPKELSIKESNVLKMTDSLRNNKRFQFYKKLTRMSVSGYWNLGKIEVGNIYTLYNRNLYEKNRFILSLRTSELFSQNAQISGFMGYGTGDQDWKYEGRYKWISKRKKYEIWDLGYRKKIEQLGLIDHIGDVGNAFTSLISYKPQDKLTLVNKGWLSLEKQWVSWFRSYHSVTWTNLDLLGELAKEEMNPISMSPMDDGFTSFQAKNQITFSKNERFIGSKFNRFSLGSSLPIISLAHTMGFKGVLDSDYQFHKLELLWKHKVNLGWFGKTKYAIHIGKIIGDVDFPFMHIHQGNETFYLQEFNFNLLNYYEFASTEWIDVFYEHNFQGIIMNRIPLLKRMKMRLNVTGKLAWGRISEQNESLELPEFINSAQSPYIELGVGLDNIFKIIRVDFITRLTHTNEGSNFGVRFSFSPQF